MVVDCEVKSSTTFEAGTPTPSDSQALIKEARRHQRLRYGSIALTLIAVSMAVLALLFVGGTSRPPPQAKTHPEAGIPAATSATCRADQLVIRYKGSQGAAGNIASAFWVANTSGSSCSLQTSVTVDLLNVSGATSLSASSTLETPVPLPANTEMPIGDTVPGGDHLASVVLMWPSVPDAALMMGSTSGVCPQPLFSPAAIRFGFNGIAPITVSQLAAGSGPAQPLSICGTHVSIANTGPLSG